MRAGPQELTAPEIAATVGETLGNEVRYRQVSGEQCIRNRHGDNIPFRPQHLDGIAELQDQDGMSGLSNVVERIRGHRPMSGADYAEKHRTAFH